MQDAKMAKLKLTALCFLLPGLAGLLISSMISVSYVKNLPKMPDPPTMRMIPRLIDGVTVYQTAAENRRLNIVEASTTTVAFIGLVLSLVYLKKWGIARALEGQEGDRGYEQE